MPYAEYASLLVAKLRDTAGIITAEQRDLLITAAVERYSQLRPRERVQTLTGNGVKVTFDLAADFDEQFSSIRSIEYPVGHQDPEYLDEGDFQFYRSPTTGALQLRLLSLVLGNTVTAYVTYLARHAVTASPAAETIPIGDREAVCDFAAALGCEQLSAYFAEEIEPSIASDLTRGQDRAQFYLTLAGRRRDAWEAAMGLGGKGDVAAASKSGDLDVELFYPGGLPRFFHGNR